MTDWSALGSDPAPGDSDVMREVAQALSTLAKDAYEAAKDLSRIAGGVSSADWTGLAAIAAHRRLDQSVPGLFSYSGAQSTAADAISTLAEVLPSLQQRARTAAETATQAAKDRDGAVAWGATSLAAIAASRARIVQHRADLLQQQAVDVMSGGASGAQQSIQQQLNAENARMDQHNADLASARKAAATAASNLDGARHDATAIRLDHENAVHECARKLGDARDRFLVTDSPIQVWLKDTIRGGKKLVTDIVASKEFEQLLNICESVSTVLTIVAVVISIFGVTAPIVGVLLLASAALSAVVLVGHVLQMANGTKKWDFVDIGIGVVGLVPGFGKAGKLLGKAGKAARFGAPALVHDARATKWAFKATAGVAGRSNARAIRSVEKQLTKVFPNARTSDIVKLTDKFLGIHPQIVHQVHVTTRLTVHVVDAGITAREVGKDAADVKERLQRGDRAGAAKAVALGLASVGKSGIGVREK